MGCCQVSTTAPISWLWGAALQRLGHLKLCFLHQPLWMKCLLRGSRRQATSCGVRAGQPGASQPLTAQRLPQPGSLGSRGRLRWAEARAEDGLRRSRAPPVSALGAAALGGRLHRPCGRVTRSMAGDDVHANRPSLWLPLLRALDPPVSLSPCPSHPAARSTPVSAWSP